MAAENSILWWSSSHRVHHKYIDKEWDPYNIKRGFWWAHMGWILAEDYQETDTRYHDFIMRCSGNRLGRSIIRAIHPHARASSRYNPPADEEDLRQGHRGHVAIYEHLLRHDADGAAAAMEEHISGTWALRKGKRG